jgi:hypothetical protein
MSLAATFFADQREQKASKFVELILFDKNTARLKNFKQLYR